MSNHSIGKQKTSDRDARARRARFEKIHDLLRPKLENYAIAKGFVLEREDIASEVILRLWKSGVEPENVVAYAFTIAQNYLRDQGRRIVENRPPLTIDQLDVHAGRRLTDHAEEVASRLDIKRAIMALPEHLREVLFLIVFCDVAKGDVAKMYGVTARTVTRWLAEARRLL